MHAAAAAVFIQSINKPTNAAHLGKSSGH